MGKRKKKQNKRPINEKPKDKPLPPVIDFSAFQTERMTRSLEKAMQEQNLDNIDDINAFLDKTINSQSLDQLQTNLSAVEKAQELAYQSMDCESDTKALKLARQALKLDPDCLDANVQVALLTSKDQLDIRERLKHAIKRHENKISHEFIQENMGHFWGIVETRPYMRTILLLAQTNISLRAIGDAIMQLEYMLSLNPNDNQGVRDILVGLYLEIGNLKSARHLMNQYPYDKKMAVFAWARVLERFLANRLDHSYTAFKKAMKINPYVADYLTGQAIAPPPQNYYTPGEESEASMCFTLLFQAWLNHPGANMWLCEIFDRWNTKKNQEETLF